jgi:hypothetical protein
MIISIPDTITHQEAERKEKFKRNSLTATLFPIYKSKQLLLVNGYGKSTPLVFILLILL